MMRGQRASKVTVTKADGTVTEEAAYNAYELSAIRAGGKLARRQQKRRGKALRAR
jgi:hypothetical protein